MRRLVSAYREAVVSPPPAASSLEHSRTESTPAKRHVAVHVRACTVADLEAVARIYNHYVLTSTCTFEEVPPSLDELRERYDAVAAKGLPWLVATTVSPPTASVSTPTPPTPGTTTSTNTNTLATDGEVIGYAYASWFRARTAYRFSVEDSIYVDHQYTGCGVGRALLSQLVALLTAQGHRQMLAVIGDAAHHASIQLHASFGFRQAGLMKSVGWKLGKWIDVVTMQLALSDGDSSPPAHDPLPVCDVDPSAALPLK
eukprot:gnl/Spiro4/7244_TR3786_c0_g2_i1.p1 gnl/Spiro4/7244_TR3786_c0_g2~~gnl/Spiro4/7244_TR3786_c0_g2_i1.p1  ORF type:complete len:257 (+),score=49.96 gnl/Spiro4/7244_TR3786_c0_g2_i1:132-902(+)